MSEEDPRKGLPSASGIARRALCPGSHNAELGQPEESSEDAQEGSELHGHMAYPETDRSGLKPEQIDALEWAEERTQEAVKEYGFEDAELLNELRLWFVNDDLELVYSGQADRVYLDEKNSRAFAPDYKFGRIAVTSAARNLQMRALAVLIGEDYGTDEVIVQINQPRLGNAEAALYTKQDLAKAKEEILSYIAEAEKPDAPRIPNYDACHYCKAKSICPEYNHIAHAFVEVAPDDLDTPEKLAMALDRGKMLKPLITAIEKKAKAMIAEDPDVLKEYGWILGKPSMMRNITDTEVAMQRLMELDGVSADTILALIKLGIGDAETIIADAKGVKGKALKEEFSKILGDLISKKPKAASLKQLAKK